MSLLYGILPKKLNGVYAREVGDRIWIKQPAGVGDELIMEMKKRLNNSIKSILMKIKLQFPAQN